VPSLLSHVGSFSPSFVTVLEASRKDTNGKRRFLMRVYDLTGHGPVNN
jgi:hypothetical protein